MPTLINTTDFTALGDIAAVGANAALAGNWTDALGGRFQVVSGVGLKCLTNDFYNGALYYAGQTRASQRIETTFAPWVRGWNADSLLGVANPAGGLTAYEQLSGDLGSYVSVGADAGNSSIQSQVQTPWTPSVGVAYLFRFDRVADGAGNSTLTISAIRVSDSVVEATATGSYSDSANSIPTAGLFALTTGYNTAGSQPTITKVSIYDLGAPSAGVASLTSASATQLGLACAAASGGTGTWTYQWHRSQASNFTPGVGTALAGKTSLSFTDTPPASTSPYYYACVGTDTSSNVVASNQVGGLLLGASLAIGFVGDSITYGANLAAGEDPASQCVAELSANLGRAATATNRGISGTQTLDWQPGGADCLAADAAFASAGVGIVHIMLGANDASFGVPAATYGSRLGAIVAHFAGTVGKVALSYPTALPVETSVAGLMDSLLVAYQAQIDALINGSTVLRGDTAGYGYTLDNASILQSDRVHPTAVGASRLGGLWARALDRNWINPAGGSGGTAAVIRSGQRRRGR